MALKWIEGYEIDQSSTYLARKYAASSGNSFVAGRLGGFAQSLGTNGSGQRTASLGAQPDWYYGIGWKANAASATVDFTVRLFTAANEQFRMRLVATAAGTINIELIRGSTTLVTYSGGALTANAWHYIEFYCLVHPSAGEYQVRVDEVDVISLTTGVNTANNGTNDADVISWNRDAGTTTIHIDDIYICDGSTAINNTFRGDSQVEGILPTTDGATTQWTPSTGTNHAALVDDAATTPNDADYNSTGTLNLIDLYNFGDLTLTTGTIYGLQVCSDARLDVAGTRGVTPRFRTGGGTGYAFDEHTVNSTSVSQFTQVIELNPDTGSFFTNSEVDNGQFGVELTT